MKLNTLFFIAAIFIFCHPLWSQADAQAKIDSLLTAFSNKDISKDEKTEILNTVYELTTLLNTDTLKKTYFAKLSLSSLNFGDSLIFRKANSKALEYSKKLKDSSMIAYSYWDLGLFHEKHGLKDYSYRNYSEAYKIFDRINTENSKINSADMLLNMAIMQKDLKDYIGSENDIIDAIKIFIELNKNERLYRCHITLGIVQTNLGEYENAIENYNKALEYLKKEGGNFKKNESTILNNIGIVYRDQGNHLLARQNYEKALQYDSLYYKNTKLYATLIDNLAYSKFKLEDHSDLPELFHKSLRIRDSLNISVGIVINKLHLSEYHLDKNNVAKSFEYANQAEELAKEIKSFEHLLDIYNLLSRIEPDDESYYLRKYIQLNDSLVQVDRFTENKFARIKFDTDRYISQNERLSLQNTWIVAISTAIIFFGFLIYVITQQRTRNKELEMEQQQQRANEEIYNLMIDQQDKIEEGRKREKERISLELHDGILGRLFGTRLSLGSLNAKDDTNSKKVREQYINELQSIEEEVRNISHELGLDNFDKSTSYSTMIANLLEEQSKITNFKYQIEDDDQILWTDIPGHIKINIYRIIQESIQNINKYAQAENVILDFKKNDEHIILTIKDDGVGFDQGKRSSGIGLKNMKSRVTLLHGQFTINSIPGKGTSISVDVPMT